MKVLLDENLPHRSRNAIAAHEVFTVRYQGWLLRTAERGGFELFHEQNLAGRQMAVLVLSAIEGHIISQSLPAIQAAIDAAPPGSHRIIDVGSFHRKHPRP